MPTRELDQNMVGAPLGWTTAELSPDDRPAALDRLQELGIDRWVVAKVCDVRRSRVTEWSKTGFPTRKGNRSMSVLDRLTGLAGHMRSDLGLNDEQVGEFILREPNSHDWQIDDLDDTARWRDASLVQTHIGGFRRLGYNGHQTIEERLQKCFTDNYKTYLGRLQEAAAAGEE